MFAGWPWSLDMAGTLGSTQRAWWWVVLMPLVQGNSGNRFSRMWVGLKFLPVFVSNSLVHDGSLWKGSFFILLNKNSRILLPFLSRCDFCRICRAFTKARRQRIIKEREMKRCNKGLQTDRLQGFQLSADFSPLLCLQVGPLNCQKMYFSCF